MRFAIFLFGTFLIAADTVTAQPSILQCAINASADRSHDSEHEWVGPLPEYGKAPDRSVPFLIARGGTESGFIFSNLQSDNPTIRPIMAWREKGSDKPVLGAEKKGTVFRRAERAVFVQWEFGPNEFYTAVLHLPSKKAAISQISTCRAGLCDVGIKAITADCQ